MQSIADRFGVAESTVVGCRDMMAVLLKLRNRLIIWPRAEELRQDEQKFSRRNWFAGTLGSIDGTHIAIKAPKENPQRYVNREIFTPSAAVCIMT